jgi:hypothetical protein
VASGLGVAPIGMRADRGGAFHGFRGGCLTEERSGCQRQGAPVMPLGQ